MYYQKKRVCIRNSKIIYIYKQRLMPISLEQDNMIIIINIKVLAFGHIYML